MKYFITSLLFLVVVACHSNASAQIKANVRLRFNEKNLHLSYTPFKKILVLDSRFDTTKIYAYEDGSYPVLNIKFDEPASVAVREYLEASIKGLPKGNETLLVDIAQLRVSNNSAVLRAQGYKAILFSADLYRAASDGNFEKIMSIEKKYDRYALYNQIFSVLPAMLDEMIEKASAADTARKKGSTAISIDQIIAQSKNRWLRYAILANSTFDKGVFINFDSFKNATVAPCNIKMMLDEKDSLYKIQVGKNDAGYDSNSKFWGVCDGEGLYIRMFNGSYLKLIKENNSFYFYLPRSLPDMHALLSIEEILFDKQEHAVSNSANLLGNFLGDGIFFITENAVIKSILNKSKKRAVKNEYRTCSIDMDSGDFIY